MKGVMLPYEWQVLRGFLLESACVNCQFKAYPNLMHQCPCFEDPFLCQSHVLLTGGPHISHRQQALWHNIKDTARSHQIQTPGGNSGLSIWPLYYLEIRHWCPSSVITHLIRFWAVSFPQPWSGSFTWMSEDTEMMEQEMCQERRFHTNDSENSLAHSTGKKPYDPPS